MIEINLLDVPSPTCCRRHCRVSASMVGPDANSATRWPCSGSKVLLFPMMACLGRELGVCGARLSGGDGSGLPRVSVDGGRDRVQYFDESRL